MEKVSFYFPNILRLKLIIQGEFEDRCECLCEPTWGRARHQM